MLTIVAEGTFDAAHKLCGHHGKCKNVHGHTWRYEFRVIGGWVDGTTGMVIDFGLLDKIAKQLDHGYLNEILETENPTCEYISSYFLELIVTQLNIREIPFKKVIVKLWESPRHHVILEQEEE
jgi:6-pyruvoyltetrahydropterin/6-carboxytetrahydropterin synthase